MSAGSKCQCTPSLPDHETLASDVLDKVLGSFTVLESVQRFKELLGPERDVSMKSLRGEVGRPTSH